LQKLLVGLAICCLAPVSAMGAEPAAVELSGAWVRALPPGQPNTAAYLMVSNRGDRPVTIVGASVPIAKTVEMHTTREVDGYQRMERLEQVQVGAGESAEFAPGGAHLMLLGLSAMPAEGQEVPICLQLDSGDEFCTVAAVRKSAGNEQSHQHHQH